MVGDRRSPNEWLEQGALDVAMRAMQKVGEILAHHYPSHLAEAVDEIIRQRFPVRLPREHMRPRSASGAQSLNTARA